MIKDPIKSTKSNGARKIKMRESPRKGKTWEEYFGKEKSIIVKKNASNAHKGIPSKRKEKTYEEIFGIEKANQLKEQLSKLKKGIARGPFSKRHRKNMSKARKGIIYTIETRKKMSLAKKGQVSHNKDKTYEKIYGKEKAEKIKKKMSKSKIGKSYEEIMGNKKAKVTRYKKSITMKDKMVGEKNPMYGKCGPLNPVWQGGISYEPYTIDFDEAFKKKIRERDNHCCLVCNMPQEKLNYKLHIHHADYNKKNSFPQNCVSLCRVCHVNTNFNRNHWKSLFQNLLKERYGYKYTSDQKIILDFV